ncbi:MAG: response regulator transcription factor [Bacteroidota bacterium]|jgi:DNA-binding response OmpR family regulator
MQANRSILIADDEPDIREFISYNLAKSGFTVFKANNGIEALELALQTKPALVILDIMMPEMNGFEASKKMRENITLDHTRIFFLSAMSENMARTSGYQIFVDGFLPKPISIKELLSRVNQILSDDIN